MYRNAVERVVPPQSAFIAESKSKVVLGGGGPTGCQNDEMMKLCMMLMYCSVDLTGTFH